MTLEHKVKMETAPHLIPALAERCVIIDGPPRTGKFLLSNIAGNLEGVEYVNHAAIHENIGLMYRMGHINREAAMAQLRLTMNVAVYERSIGRHLNSRPSDRYSIFNSLEITSTLARATRTDGPKAVHAYLATGVKPLMLTHDMMPNIDLFFEVQPGLKVLLLLRHPVDTVTSWWKKGWGERYGVDPLAVSACAATSMGPCPWWALEWAEEYFAMTPVDRCIRGVLDIFKGIELALARLPANRRECIHIINFEALATQPIRETENMADFLGVTVPKRIGIIFARECVPRVLVTADWNEKFAELSLASESARLLENIREASLDYERQYLGNIEGCEQ